MATFMFDSLPAIPNGFLTSCSASGTELVVGRPSSRGMDSSPPWTHLESVAAQLDASSGCRPTGGDTIIQRAVELRSAAPVGVDLRSVGRDARPFAGGAGRGQLHQCRVGDEGDRKVHQHQDSHPANRLALVEYPEIGQPQHQRHQRR